MDSLMTVAKMYCLKWIWKIAVMTRTKKLHQNSITSFCKLSIVNKFFLYLIIDIMTVTLCSGVILMLATLIFLRHFCIFFFKSRKSRN